MPWKALPCVTAAPAPTGNADVQVSAGWTQHSTSTGLALHVQESNLCSAQLSFAPGWGCPPPWDSLRCFPWADGQAEGHSSAHWGHQHKHPPLLSRCGCSRRVVALLPAQGMLHAAQGGSSLSLPCSVLAGCTLRAAAPKHNLPQALKFPLFPGW